MSESSAFAGVVCTVEIYPFEGGKYTLQGGQILSCSVNKSIRGGAAGTFALALAPGGPFGPESVPTWTEIITPLSFVLIGMQRGSEAAIVMAGLVTSTGEQREFTSTAASAGSMAQRVQYIQGEDFTLYFNARNYTALSLFGLTAGLPFAQSLGMPVGAAFADSVAQGLTGGTAQNPVLGGPAQNPTNAVQVARVWYESIMLGKGGMMGDSYVPYQPAGTRVHLSDAIRRVWENFPVYVAFGSYYVAVEGNWMAKFQDMLPFPWYEFFVTTAPVNAYDGKMKSARIDPGKSFSMTAMPLAKPVSPTVVARVNPTPVLKTTVAGPGQAIKLGSIDVERWSQLTVYDTIAMSFFSSSISFSTDEVRNIYILNPTSYAPLYGVNNANTNFFIYTFTALGDSASIHRYGYRPEYTTTMWFFDQLGLAAQTPALDVTGGIARCTAMIAGQYHPTPFMARGSVSLPLRPDILPGNIFRYPPFKSAKPGNENWDFYIEGIRHDFVFGGRSRTTLTLSRGLPSAVYADTTDGGLLQSIWLGNAQRLDGEYKVGLPKDSSPYLESIGAIPSTILDFLGHVGKSYVTPQSP